jgi:hypothetical protein
MMGALVLAVQIILTTVPLTVLPGRPCAASSAGRLGLQDLADDVGDVWKGIKHRAIIDLRTRRRSPHL